MSVENLQLTDSFSQWREKINALMSEFTLSVSSFAYDPSQSSGLNVHFDSGQVRNNSKVETVESRSITLPANTISVVAIVLLDEEFEFGVFDLDSLPYRGIIPLWLFETGPGTLIGEMDLRTQFIYTSPVGDVGPIMTFDQLISSDTVIPGDRNALSVSPVVEDGVTVTVEPGAIWVVV